MLGQGIGYLSMDFSSGDPFRTLTAGEAGGMIGDAFGIRRPFEVAFCSFLIAAAYVRVALPKITPESMSDGKKPAVKGLGAFVAPLKLLKPQKIALRDGRTVKHRGVLFLCSGVFLGVVSGVF